MVGKSWRSEIERSNSASKTAGSNSAYSTDEGFTLVELLVVLVILGLLAGLAGPRILQYLGKSKQETAALQIENFKTALDLYRLDVSNFPTTQQGLGALIERPPEVESWAGPYLKDVPQDPWDNAYIYKSPGEQGDYDLSSLGADKRPGGDGDNSDITSW